jgi:hypothetical protein
VDLSGIASFIPTFHTGGVVGALRPGRYVHPSYFDTARRYHAGGGIGADEVPIIAQKGETILTSRQTGIVDAALSTGGPPKLIVNVINNAGVKATPSNPQQQPDGSISFDLLLDRIDGGLADKQAKGNSVFGTTIVSQHGLKKDVQG